MSVPAAALLRDADLCVKCGLCLPHCPTYGVTRHEADGPRGRIALIQGLLSGAPASPALEAHLDGCLVCRTCEAVCPVHVPFARLLDGAREKLIEGRPRRAWLTHVAATVLLNPLLRWIVRAALHLYQQSGLQPVARRLLAGTRIGRLESLLPKIHRRSPPVGAFVAAPVRGELSLFQGCLGHWVDQPLLEDSISLLNRLGWSVGAPLRQGCCGALHQHAGLAERTRQLAGRNIEAFSGTIGPIASCATGCGATLTEYGAIVDSAAARSFANRVQDIHGLLLAGDWSDAELQPLDAIAAVHTPCTLRNVVGHPDAVTRLLEKVPGLQLHALDPRAGCCGAAGSYFVAQPEMADRLVAHAVREISALRPDFVVSSNSGCSMHLAAALRRAGVNAEVIHPVSLVARQYRKRGSTPPPGAATAVRPARPA